jgi:hypothetical protein
MTPLWSCSRVPTDAEDAVALPPRLRYFVRVKEEEEVLRRIHDLGYSLGRFGEIDAQIAGSRHFREPEPSKPERYGKKYSWIAFYELGGFRSDTGLLEDKSWRGFEPHPEEVDIDPSFPDQPPSRNVLDADILGKRYPDAVQWVNNGPIPSVRKWLVCRNLRFLKDQWVLAHGGVYVHSREAGRTGYLRVRAHFLAEGDLAKLKRFLRSREAHFEDEPDTQEIEGFFAGEFLWHRRIPYTEPESVRVPVGRHKVAIPQVRLAILSLGEKELRIGGENQPAQQYETVHESVEMIPLVQRRFSAVKADRRICGNVVETSNVEHDRQLRATCVVRHECSGNSEFQFVTTYSQRHRSRIYETNEIARSLGCFGREAETVRVRNERRLQTILTGFSSGESWYRKIV